jgi:hypothetical protein
MDTFKSDRDYILQKESSQNTMWLICFGFHIKKSLFKSYKCQYHATISVCQVNFVNASELRHPPADRVSKWSVSVLNGTVMVHLCKCQNFKIQLNKMPWYDEIKSGKKANTFCSYLKRMFHHLIVRNATKVNKISNRK